MPIKSLATDFCREVLYFCWLPLWSNKLGIIMFWLSSNSCMELSDRLKQSPEAGCLMGGSVTFSSILMSTLLVLMGTRNKLSDYKPLTPSQVFSFFVFEENNRDLHLRFQRLQITFSNVIITCCFLQVIFSSKTTNIIIINYVSILQIKVFGRPVITCSKTTCNHQRNKMY